MALSVRAITAEEHLAFVRSRPSASFLQCPSWAEVKREWGHENIGWYDDAGALVGHRVDVLEDRQQIVGERNEIRQDHVVERLVEHDLLRSADVELELRMARARELDHAWAHVYAHAAVGVKGGQEITAAGAELEHRSALGHEEPERGFEQPVIRTVTPTPALLVRRELIEERDHLRERLPSTRRRRRVRNALGCVLDHRQDDRALALTPACDRVRIEEARRLPFV